MRHFSITGRAELVEAHLNPKLLGAVLNKRVFQPIHTAVTGAPDGKPILNLAATAISDSAKRAGKRLRIAARKTGRVAGKVAGSVASMAPVAAAVPLGAMMMATNESGIVRRAKLREAGNVLTMLKDGGAAVSRTLRKAVDALRKDRRGIGSRAGAIRSTGQHINAEAAGFMGKHVDRVKPVVTLLTQSDRGNPGNLNESEGEIEMSRGEFKREHKRLLGVLSKCKAAACKQEASKQRKEMRKELRKKD